MPSLEVGQLAPDFTLMSQSGESVTLHDLRGQVVVLYFYPKDDTPGCTKEACGFRDLKAAFADVGGRIFGVSRDTVASHQRFATKYGLTFDLLADPDETVCNAYGVLKEKNMYGRVSIGIERTTFIIDSEGRIAHVFPKVKVDGHVDAVLDAVRQISQS